MNPNMTASQALNFVLDRLSTIISKVSSWLYIIAQLLILAILLGTTARAAGHVIPYLPTMGWTELAYAAGAFWLLRR